MKQTLKQEKNIEKEKIQTQDENINSDDVEIDPSYNPITQVNKITISKVIASKTYVEQWVNRRRMAWTMLLSMLAFTGLVLFAVPLDRLKAAENVLSWYFMMGTTIVCAYYGTSVVSSLYRKP